MSILSAIGGIVGGLLGNSSAKAQIRAQQEALQNSVSWRVADAKRAGVHPVTALGMQPMNISPVQTPDFGELGQNVGRALDATQTRQEKENDYTKAAQVLSLERAGLENDLLKARINSEIAVRNQPGTPPPMPALDSRGDLIDGQVYQVPGKPTRREVQEHNRWNEANWKLPPGPTGEDWESQISEWGNIPAGFRALRILQMNYPWVNENLTGAHWERIRRKLRDEAYSRKWNRNKRPTGAW